MGIIKEEFSAVKCDGCGKVCDGSEYSYWSDEDGAKDNAMDSDWLMDFEGKDYCTNCYEMDGEDNINLTL